MPAENVNNSYFDGHYKDIWRHYTPDGLTKVETEFLIQDASLKQGSKILDLMCGYGRNAIALAEKGMKVTAVDNLADYVNEIQEKAAKENLSLDAVQADVLMYKPNDVFDLVICMGNSICFFNANDTATIFSNISAHLRKGGKFIFGTWTIAEIAIKQFNKKEWNFVGDLKFLTDSQYLFNPTRIESDTFIITPSGETEVKKSVDYIYSVSETTQMLKQAGLELKEIYSVPGKKKFTLGDPRAYFVAEKV